MKHRGPELNKSEKVSHQIYLIPSKRQLKYTIAFAYVDSLTPFAPTVADREAAMMVEAHDQEVNYLKSKEICNVSEKLAYFMFYEIPEE